ncbi:MAG: outer membrane lipoprotein-sorting protein [Saprospiraceae bacterium]|nr:outer membrane lipoprotein-sorting protein [Saprospiraceae bacterium]
MKIIKSISLSILFASVCVSTIQAQSLPAANEIVKSVNSRNEGEHVIQNFNMMLTNKNGQTQSRETVIYRKDYKDQRKTMIVFKNPSNVKGTGFMSFDYNDKTKEDDQWLYLPALKKTRRISASNRGDYFLGTDFTYEDIKLGSKLSTTNYSYKTVKEETIDGHKCYLLEGTPLNEKVKKELGYGKVHYWVDAQIWFVRKTMYWDVAGNLLKTTNAQTIEKIEGIWSIKKLEAENHKTSHKTLITFSAIDYKTQIEDDLFTEESLMRGGK